MAEPSNGPTLQPNKTVAYFYDADVGNYSYGYGHPMKPHRMRMTHNLVSNYGLDKHMDMLRPKRATREQMAAFHTDEYVDFLHRVTPETMQDLTGDGQRFLIGEDCPAFEGLWEFCTMSAGGSIAAAERVSSGKADIAINWAGGLHHAKKQEASGFCYVNDIVVGILELLRMYQRVLYIDIDIHHGDGVEEAFYTTDRVMTVSFHKYGDFFPGTGDVRDVGMKKGKGYAVNVPFRDGIEDTTFGVMFSTTIQYIMDWYRPGAVVLQCGADSLAGDKLGCFNLSMQGHAACVRIMKAYDVPLLVLGGGGYTIRNVAKTWTYETGVCANKELDENLPFNDYMQYFGPEYKLEVPPCNMDNKNSREYLEQMRAKIFDNLRSLPFAPSVQMQETPKQSLNISSLELSEDEDSDLDERITQKMKDAHIERYGDEMSDTEDGGNWDGMSIDGGQRSGRGSRRKNGAASNVGIAGGPRGSAPWKNSSASANDLSLGPKSSTYLPSSGLANNIQQQKTKRSFFRSRVPDVDWQNSVPHVVGGEYDDLDMLGHQDGTGYGADRRTNGKKMGMGAAASGGAANVELNGHVSHTGSDRAESPMVSSARDSPAVG